MRTAAGGVKVRRSSLEENANHCCLHCLAFVKLKLEQKVTHSWQHVHKCCSKAVFAFENVSWFNQCLMVTGKPCQKKKKRQAKSVTSPTTRRGGEKSSKQAEADKKARKFVKQQSDAVLAWLATDNYRHLARTYTSMMVTHDAWLHFTPPCLWVKFGLIAFAGMTNERVPAAAGIHAGKFFSRRTLECFGTFHINDKLLE